MLIINGMWRDSVGTGPNFLQGNIPATQAVPTIVAGKSSIQGNTSSCPLQLTSSALASPKLLRSLFKSELAKIVGQPRWKTVLRAENCMQIKCRYLSPESDSHKSLPTSILPAFCHEHREHQKFCFCTLLEIVPCIIHLISIKTH